MLRGTGPIFHGLMLAKFSGRCKAWFAAPAKVTSQHFPWLGGFLILDLLLFT